MLHLSTVYRHSHFCLWISSVTYFLHFLELLAFISLALLPYLFSSLLCQAHIEQRSIVVPRLFLLNFQCIKEIQPIIRMRNRRALYRDSLILHLQHQKRFYMHAIEKSKPLFSRLWETDLAFFLQKPFCLVHTSKKRFLCTAEACTETSRGRTVHLATTQLDASTATTFTNALLALSASYFSYVQCQAETLFCVYLQWS